MKISDAATGEVLAENTQPAAYRTMMGKHAGTQGPMVSGAAYSSVADASIPCADLIQGDEYGNGVRDLTIETTYRDGATAQAAKVQIQGNSWSGKCEAGPRHGPFNPERLNSHETYEAEALVRYIAHYL